MRSFPAQRAWRRTPIHNPQHLFEIWRFNANLLHGPSPKNFGRRGTAKALDGKGPLSSSSVASLDGIATQFHYMSKAS